MSFQKQSIFPQNQDKLLHSVGFPENVYLFLCPATFQSLLISVDISRNQIGRNRVVFGAGILEKGNQHLL